MRLTIACGAASLQHHAHTHAHPTPGPQPLGPWHRRELLLHGTRTSLAALACAAAALLLPPPPPAAAAIPLGLPSPADVEEQRAQALRQLVGRYQVRASAPAEAPEPTSVRIQRLQALMAAGNEARARGDYEAALAKYDEVVKQFPDFATTEYARLARALMLYQLGSVSDAILQLQDLEVSLRGYAEVHAALAAILYVERPALLEVAEQQWEIGQEFNKSFADPQWVADTKGWPPRLMAALDRFLKLQ